MQPVKYTTGLRRMSGTDTPDPSDAWNEVWNEAFLTQVMPK